MCVLALAWKAHPRWHLVAVANRDELHARPAEGLHRWESAPGVIAGRDLLSGGTWLGIAPGAGRFCAVTNVAGGAGSVSAPSRGGLVCAVLDSAAAPPDPAPAQLGAFNGFNLMLVAGGEAWRWTNVPQPARQRLARGVHSLSNGDLSNPWPKAPALEAKLAGWLDSERPADDLLDVLSSSTPFDPLPGMPLSSASLFIRNAVYGTRCSTVVAVASSGQGVIVERRFDAAGEVTGETSLSFDWRLPKAA